MSEQNVEIIRRGFASLSREGIDSLAEFLHPEFVTETPPDMALEPDTYVGIPGIRRWFDSFYDAVDEVRFEADEFIDVGGDKVMVEARMIVRGRDSGIEVEQHMVQVWTLRDGLATRLEVFPDREPALAAIERAGKGVT